MSSLSILLCTGKKKSNVHFLKRNISQFSGFVWTDNQEKHRNMINDKLDKFNKEKLLHFCQILDIHVSKATTKKEEVSFQVLTDDKKKRLRRSKGNGQATSDGASSDKETWICDWIYDCFLSAFDRSHGLCACHPSQVYYTGSTRMQH